MENKNQLFGARDNFGIKPFYYTQMNNNLIFGSEIKSFLHHTPVVKEGDEVATGINHTPTASGATQTSNPFMPKFPSSTKK